ncbi:hypothetical protein JGH11_02340 [Dysgonomonas sp. Marseille-P4677]|uniref:hypothetical protein n=1 Tax=Dysgonomonas sp. Marseille-P4677 TaxID=2364790 RepID=UPI0019135414|nr:hypothetical protein [Dysgonomonas sp. Marseille-P4677]MBK5719705.1 hypothetical protein [Dysgonomonas sp. Marseille-P4677]
MKKRFLSIILFYLLISFSCKNKEAKDNISNSSETNKTQEQETLNMRENDELLKIKFSEVTVSFPKSIILLNEEEPIIEAYQSDSIHIIIEMGETIEGQLIEIITDNLNNMKIEQCYETSITVMNEGPHCDLTNWRHYLSNWIELNKNTNNQFICYTYEDNEKEIFPEIDIEELKDAVLVHCGEKWHELIKEKSNPKEYPFGVGISRYYLKITGYNEKEFVSKIIILENPMGC